MVCILTQEVAEATTEHVMRWLGSMRVPFVRLHCSDLANMKGAFVRLREGAMCVRLEVDGRDIDLAEVRAVWYRRWYLGSIDEREGVWIDGTSGATEMESFVVKHLHRERLVASQCLFEALKAAEWLSTPGSARLHKLDVLRRARACGLDVPDSVVTADVEEARRFVKSHGRAVTKALGEPAFGGVGSDWAMTYTTEVAMGDLDELDGWRGGFPSLFQEYVPKEYELRTFYLCGEFFSMAIFSQEHECARVDFRRGAGGLKSRCVPYSLPKSVEAKLRRLMEVLALDTASIDMIRAPNGRMVFLEVNPVGQFGMVSAPCNYGLERRVAEVLAKRTGI